MLEFLVTLISSAAVSAILASGIIWLTREWISARIKNSIQHEYDQKLESHKAKLNAENQIAIAKLTASIEKEAAIQIAAHSSFSQGQKAAMERKLSAIDAVWKSILNLRNNSPPSLTFLDLITAEEYMTVLDHPNFRSMIDNLSEENIVLLATASDVESARPYVGEYVWALHYAYQAITLRTIFLLFSSKKDPSKIEWFKDSGIRQLMKVALPEKEIEEFDSQEFGKLGWLRKSIESKIMSNISKVISGEAFGDDAIKQAAKIIQATEKLSARAV
jgi:hypothetical protein